MRQEGKWLAGICTVIYFVSYLTRHNFAAVLAEIIASGTASEAAAAVTTVGFITYGCGQLISGFLGDQLPPEKLILGGLLLTTSMNFLLPFCSAGWQMCLVWGVNGAAQAMLWPPMVKLLSVLEEGEYQKACANVTIGGAVGTITIYCLVPLVLMVADWRGVFYVCTAFGVAASILWGTRIGRVLSCLPKPGEEKKTGGSRVLIPSVCIPITLIVLLAIIAQGILRDGITTWAPVYLNQVYHLDTAVSIFITVSIPVLSIAGIKLTAAFYNRALKEEQTCAGLLFLAAAVCGLVLALFPTSSPILFAAGAAVMTACMHGINLLLISVFPLRYKKFGRISLISGLFNFSVYIGSALSSIGFERISQHFGWQSVVALWMAISLLGAFLCWGAHKKGFPE